MDSKLNVLLVEDDSSYAQLIHNLLRDVGTAGLKTAPAFELEHVDRLSGALKRLSEGGIDLVLLDLLLPDSRGLTAFLEVQKRMPEVPVIVLSGIDDESLAVEAVRKGAQDYLVKSHIDIHLLVRAMLYGVERKQVEDEKVAMQRQLNQRQKMEAIGILAGGIAHDFNNLLTTIIGCADMAMMEIDNKKSVSMDLKEIRDAADRAADLTSQLLLFSRKKPMHFTRVDLNQTIEDLLKMLHRVIGEDVEIKTELKSDLWNIRADRGTMGQVIMNLVVNARDAMPGGGSVAIKTRNISLTSSQCRCMPEASPGRYVCLSVSDTGAGIDEESLRHIFEPFFSTKGVGKGTGLGLSVVYGIVKQHGGWVHVTSEPGIGSAFEIYLKADSEQATLKTKPKRKLPWQSYQGRGQRILVVEDEEKVREFTACGLNRSGYEVFSAADAQEAGEVFRKERGKFHLVLSDVVLPDKCGLELVEEFVMSNPNLRVLLSSGYTDHRSRWPIIQEKGYRFLEKPYTLNDLLLAVQELAA